MKKEYQVKFTNAALKQLEYLPQEFASKVTLALALIAQDPFIVGKKLHGERMNSYTYRVWPYRIVYEIRNEQVLVVVLKIAHRKDAYK